MLGAPSAQGQYFVTRSASGNAAADAAPAAAELLSLHRTLMALDPKRPPEARQVCGPALAGSRRLVVVAGSFNPPHAAHMALLLAGARIAYADSAVFVLSARTVDKERPSGLLLEDRLWLLCRITGSESQMPLEEAIDPHRGGTGERPGSKHPAGAGSTPTLDWPASRGVIATNSGLYVDQAAALHWLCPNLEALYFIVGFDKIVQIFDPRYYQDREAALSTLFATARFLVAPRDTHTTADLAGLLADPANERFAPSVAPLVIDRALARVSSTAARQAIAAGQPIQALVPASVAQFVAATGCFTAPEGEGPYAERVAAFRLLVSSLPRSHPAPGTGAEAAGR